MASSLERVNKTHVGLPVRDEVDPEDVPHGLPGRVQLIQDKGPTVRTQNLNYKEGQFRCMKTGRRYYLIIQINIDFVITFIP